MKDAARQTRSHLMSLFGQQGLQPRDDLGQNFLVDLNLHDLIARHARLTTADVVFEVGTGTGGLTMHLAPWAGHIVSVEFDPHVYGHARALLGGQPNVTLLQGDALASKHTFNPDVIAALKRAFEQVSKREARDYPTVGGSVPKALPAADAATNPVVPSPVAADEPNAVRDDDEDFWQLQPRTPTIKLVANLPYHVATPIISNLVASDLPWSRMVVTIQYELAERMLAKPSTSDYSALTVWLQSQCRLKILRKLPPSVFWPPPKVDSAVIVIDRDGPRQAALPARDQFHEFVRDVFTQRRKRLAGVIAGLDHAALRLPVIAKSAIELWLQQVKGTDSVRAEELTVAEWIRLWQRLSEN